MRRFAFILLGLGGVTLVFAGMLGIDAYMTDARKDAVRADINSGLDASAARYEERREAGCIRRCAGSGAQAIVSLRDGLFLSRPFNPEAAMPIPPADWQVGPYTLSAAEEIMGHRVRRTVVSRTTSNRLLLNLDKLATKGSYSAAQIYQIGESQIAVAIAIDRDAIREAKKGEVAVDSETAPVWTYVAGLPVRRHPQTSYNSKTNEEYPVDYAHLSMDLDGQVEILILGRAEDEALMTLVLALPIEEIVETLPHMPAGFAPDLPNYAAVTSDG